MRCQSRAFWRNLISPIEQAEYRTKLVAGWGIHSGAKVLELGCGQGDTTAALAHAVGGHGLVLAVDCAPRDYGSPQTVGEATDLLKASSIGEQIEFRFKFDVLDPHVAFDIRAFDYVVFAHSCWYFGSTAELDRTLAKLQPWAKKLCIAEWDLEPRCLDEVGHLLAVLIQGQVEAFKANSWANVRTPISRAHLKALLGEQGWKICSEETVDAGLMQDADWEIQACLASTLSDARQLSLPSKFIGLLETQIDTLKQIALPDGNRALSAYSIVAEW